MQKPIRRIIVLLVIVIALPFAISLTPDALGLVAFSGTYSEGVRTGQVVKLSERGVVWKTWEATLGITQSGAYAEKWNVSVDMANSRSEELIARLQEAQRTGAVVAIHYRQHYGVRRWHGKTSYFVESVDARK